jgi:hypothetical protein
MSTILATIKRVQDDGKVANVPKGWKTIHQIKADEAPNRSLEGIRKRLQLGVRLKVIEAKKYYAPYRDTVRHQLCYREIPKK